MTFLASTLGMMLDSRSINMLDPDIGIEIFYDNAPDAVWNTILPEIMENRNGEFSVHSPFLYNDILRENEKTLFEIWKRPLDLYKKFNGKRYVIHTYGEKPVPDDEAERKRLRETVTNRIRRFSDICAEEGVRIVAENVFTPPDKTIFTQEQFVELFNDVPNIDALIDVGHAIITGYDISYLQRKLKNRLIAYHMHTNDGVSDLHLRVTDKRGVLDWSSFFKNYSMYTPNAALIMEYAGANTEDYHTDKAQMLQWLNSQESAVKKEY